MQSKKKGFYARMEDGTEGFAVMILDGKEYTEDQLRAALSVALKALRELHAAEHAKLGEMLLDKSEDGQSKANWQGGRVNGIGAAISALSAQVQDVAAPHPDDLAVDRFAIAMKAKLAQKRTEGRSGWDNPDACSVEWLSELLIRHIEKGDPIDVGNFAMMIHQRGGSLRRLGRGCRRSNDHPA